MKTIPISFGVKHKPKPLGKYYDKRDFLLASLGAHCAIRDGGAWAFKEVVRALGLE